MKLSANTIKILQNFATIQPSILIRSGNVLSTKSLQGGIIARATA